MESMLSVTEFDAGQDRAVVVSTLHHMRCIDKQTHGRSNPVT
jgi:hypothetical protein